MRRYLFSVLVLIGLLGLIGCDSNKATVAAPERTSASAVQHRYVTDVTGTTYMLVVSIGKITVVCVCDYPAGFMGPLPSGHCRDSGPSYPRDYVATKLEVGQTFSRMSKADNDGIVLHK